MKKLIYLIIAITVLGFIVTGCNNPVVPPSGQNESINIAKNNLSYKTDLIAGQHTISGSITVSNDDENLFITYETVDNWLINETHLYVGTTIPTKSAPGKFPYKHEELGGVKTDLYIIPLFDLNIGLGDIIYIAAHADLVDGVVSETGWAEGVEIRLGKNWAMYFEYQVTCDTLQDVLFIHNLAEKKLNDIVEGPGIDIEDILNILGNYLNEQTCVKNTSVDGNIIQINYVSGLVSFIFLQDPNATPTAGGNTRETLSSIPLSQQTQGTNVTVPKSSIGESNLLKANNIEYTGNCKIFIWVPIAAEMESFNVVQEFKNRFEDSDLSFDISYLENEAADIDSLKYIAEYDGMVIFNTHGTTNNYLCTGALVNFWNTTRYAVDLLLGNIGIWNNMMIKEEGGVLSAHKAFAVNSKFLSKHISGNFLNTIIINLSCHNGTEEWWNVFENKGAGAYFGFSDTTTERFATEQGYDLVEKLRNGNLTTGDAYEEKTDPYGSKKATWLMWGKENLKFPKGLINGSFEEGLKSWQSNGDGRVIYDLGPIEPTHGNKMGIISTGLGYTTNYGSVQQTFQIGENYQALRFSWNYLSEEFLEWINSIYQDPFKVTLTSVDDSSTVILLSRTVDNIATEFGASWSNGGDLIYVSPDIIFDMGDVWMTGWQNFEYNISAFQGSVVTIKFEVVDEGDEIFDTAVLLDNIRLE